MIGMLMCQQDRRYLFRLVAQSSERFHVAADIFSRICKTLLVRCFFRCSGRKTGIDKNDFVSCVDQIILKTASVSDVRIKFLHSFFTAECKRLCVESVLSELDCFDLHKLILLVHSSYRFETFSFIHAL